jgi:hypothetical protein
MLRSAEQNNGIQQVNSEFNRSILNQQFNQVVQSNASASEELRSTSEGTFCSAEELKKRISFLRLSRRVFSRGVRVQCEKALPGFCRVHLLNRIPELHYLTGKEPL